MQISRGSSGASEGSDGPESPQTIFPVGAARLPLPPALSENWMQNLQRKVIFPL